MADDSADDGPVRIPIDDDSDDPGAESTDGGRGVALVMFALAAIAFAVVYRAARGGDGEELEPPF